MERQDERSRTHDRWLVRNAMVCGLKRYFETHEAARAQAVAFTSQTGVDMWTYRCKACLGWHTTTKAPRHVRKKRNRADKAVQP